MVSKPDRKLFFEAHKYGEDRYVLEFLNFGGGIEFFGLLVSTCVGVKGIELMFNLMESVVIQGEEGIRFWKDTVSNYIFEDASHGGIWAYFLTDEKKLIRNDVLEIKNTILEHCC